MHHSSNQSFIWSLFACISSCYDSEMLCIQGMQRGRHSCCQRILKQGQEEHILMTKWSNIIKITPSEAARASEFLKMEHSLSQRRLKVPKHILGRTINPKGGNNIKGRKLWRYEPSFTESVDPLIPLEQSLQEASGALRREGWVDMMPVGLDSQAKTYKFHSVENDQPQTF